MTFNAAVNSNRLSLSFLVVLNEYWYSDAIHIVFKWFKLVSRQVCQFASFVIVTGLTRICHEFFWGKLYYVVELNFDERLILSHAFSGAVEPVRLKWSEAPTFASGQFKVFQFWKQKAPLPFTFNVVEIMSENDNWMLNIKLASSSKGTPRDYDRETIHF